MKVEYSDEFNGDDFYLKLIPETGAEGILLKLLESGNTIEFDWDSDLQKVVMFIQRKDKE